MKKLPYEQIWFSLDEYLIDNTFGKPYLSTVPPKWKKEFSTITEMYNTIMLDIQHHVNLFFNELFSHIEVNMLPINKVKLIKAACYSTFVSKLYGMLITNKNIKQTFSNNSGYSIEENQTRETNHYQDIFTPSALKALNQTQIKQLWKVHNTWEQVFIHIKDKNFDYIYTAAEIDELIEIIRIESENLFKDIATYVEDRLIEFKNGLSEDDEFIDKFVDKVVERPEIPNKTAAILVEDKNFIENLGENIVKDKDFQENSANNLLENETFKDELIAGINIDLTNDITKIKKEIDLIKINITNLEKQVSLNSEKINENNLKIGDLSILEDK